MNEFSASNIADNPKEDMVSESKMGGKYRDIDLFPADKLLSKMGNNLAAAEAQIDDRVLWTEKTAEILSKENK